MITFHACARFMLQILRYWGAFATKTAMATRTSKKQ